MAVLASIDRPAIERVWDRIRHRLRLTPVLPADGSDFGLAPFPLTLKLE